MNQALTDLLDRLRNAAESEREKGTSFENLICDFLKNDPAYGPQFSEVKTYQEWAKERGLDERDTGIDLVAKLADSDDYCAVQCKFYDPDYRIQKGDLDSFFNASGKKPFVRGIIVDTTRRSWSEHAEAALNDPDRYVLYTRLGLSELEASTLDWTQYAVTHKVAFKKAKTLLDHQKTALAKVETGFKTSDRGKLIMACGTGKTFTSLKIAEHLAGKGKRVLYLVPSLALMSQTVREWSNDASLPLHSFAVCSDVHVGKRRDADDIADITTHDLAFPATTNAQAIARKVSADEPEKMMVVFSTYQSIQVISDAQLQHGMADFDLIICDEAHRTTGATFEEGKDSDFVKVHKQDYIRGTKRLYMTATPRIFGDAVKAKANEHSIELCSMDREDQYGPTFHEVSFSYAVEHNLLTDYKVIVLAVDEATVSAGVQSHMRDEDNELQLDDVTKIIGCYKALTKANLKSELVADQHPMRRALAFCKSIKTSKAVRDEFKAVVDEYLGSIEDDGTPKLACDLRHVDGTYNAKARQERLDWLSEDAGDTCRILTNARCLSEGVDVPALDAIIFMHPRKSQVDVVQSVGRVMRRAEGKQLGYVILPIGIPAGMTADQALADNKKYQVVWQILNALRAHDDRFNATINKAQFGEDVSDKIEIIATVDRLPNRTMAEEARPNIGSGGSTDDEKVETSTSRDLTPRHQFSLDFDEFQKAVLARIVKKCGTRTYWVDWANDIAKIAQAHITRIMGLITIPDSPERKEFYSFLAEIQDDLNETITEGDAVEMLAQHLITKPVFEALFEGYSFTDHNPVSRAMQKVLEVLEANKIDKEAQSLEKFYASVRLRVEGIKTAEAKQKLMLELYDKFFRNAFPRLTEKLGIVYTPVEVVDFIIHSVNDVLEQEFGQTLGSKGVHILDPFTGTGTFITRLLQSGLITPEELAHKYRHEIHANEIVLLAYYIAAINIEQVYHDLSGGEFEPFGGICLTDTFQLYEKDDMVSRLMADNSNRRERQKALDIRVIVGNPPYSAGQKSENDNAKNVAYPKLDGDIRNSYAKHSTATLQKNLYDSYIRAIRWGSDRIGDCGVMAYVSNASYLDSGSMDGLRKCLVDEFSSLYIFHLRGNARTSGEQRRKEKDNVFGQGTRTPVAIAILVKNPKSTEHGTINFHDIGDYLTQAEKLALIQKYGSVKGLARQVGWKTIVPDQHNDWLGQRDTSFDKFVPLGDKGSKTSLSIFANYSQGVLTSRDAWCYNASRDQLAANMGRTIEVFNDEVSRYSASAKTASPKDFADKDPHKISWSRALLSDLSRGKVAAFHSDHIVNGVYRPFAKQWVYFDRQFNEMLYQMHSIFPTPDHPNRVIAICGSGTTKAFSPLMLDRLPNFHTMDTGQSFPLRLYEKNDSTAKDLFSLNSEPEYTVKDGISRQGLDHFLKAYPGEKITKEDIFYYVYGLLHSEDYRSRFADNLGKELPRIPCVKNAADFWAFVEAGRKLGDLHVNYETVEPYPVTLKGNPQSDADYRVTKMKFPRVKNDEGKSVNDLTTIIYNSKITMTDIPTEAYDYVVNGKSAIEWVVERQCVKQDKDSGIINDANLYALETVGDAAYPLKLLQRVITVSLETMKIVRALPKLGDLS